MDPNELVAIPGAVVTASRKIMVRPSTATSRTTVIDDDNEDNGREVAVSLNQTQNAVRIIKRQASSNTPSRASSGPAVKRSPSHWVDDDTFAGNDTFTRAKSMEASVAHVSEQDSDDDGVHDIRPSSSTNGRFASQNSQRPRSRSAPHGEGEASSTKQRSRPSLSSQTTNGNNEGFHSPLGKGLEASVNASLKPGEYAIDALRVNDDIDTFSLIPHPSREVVFARMTRRKISLTGYEYNMMLDNEDDGNPILLSAIKTFKPGHIKYVIASTASDCASKSTRLAVMRGNFTASKFNIFGAEGSKGSILLGQIWYPTHRVKGATGVSNKQARELVVRVPKQKMTTSSKDFIVDDETDTSHSSDWHTLVNITPENVAGENRLHFYGRATLASVKNFQLIFKQERREEAPRIIMLFGKTGSDSYSLDYRSPMTGLVAFCVALSSFETSMMESLRS